MTESSAAGIVYIIRLMLGLSALALVVWLFIHFGWDISFSFLPESKLVHSELLRPSSNELKSFLKTTGFIAFYIGLLAGVLFYFEKHVGKVLEKNSHLTESFKSETKASASNVIDYNEKNKVVLEMFGYDFFRFRFINDPNVLGLLTTEPDMFFNSLKNKLEEKDFYNRLTLISDYLDIQMKTVKYSVILASLKSAYSENTFNPRYTEVNYSALLGNLPDVKSSLNTLKDMDLLFKNQRNYTIGNIGFPISDTKFQESIEEYHKYVDIEYADNAEKTRNKKKIYPSEIDMFIKTHMKVVELQNDLKECCSSVVLDYFKKDKFDSDLLDSVRVKHYI